MKVPFGKLESVAISKVLVFAQAQQSDDRYATLQAALLQNSRGRLRRYLTLSWSKGRRRRKGLLSIFGGVPRTRPTGQQSQAKQVRQQNKVDGANFRYERYREVLLTYIFPKKLNHQMRKSIRFFNFS